VTVTICDVAPRDGLQNEDTHLDPETRAELVNRLAAAGVPRIEAVSFVNPARVPQMAGAEEVVAGIERQDGVVYAGLVLNERGYDRLAATALDGCTWPSPPPRPSTGATRTRRPRSRSRRPLRSSRAHTPTTCARR
jgi:isopropylmalate/homocitrate/citramalate synthase